jgi:predicted membrane channel-forming protein YqfA (hemolysin III family)
MQLLKWPALGHPAKADGEAKAKAGRKPLRKINEVDHYQRSNPFIRSGYRHNLDLFSCLKSLTFLHNETVNIWSHLFGFVVFFGLLLRDIFLVIPSLRSDSVGMSDIVVLVGVIVCYQVSMIMSSVFHTFTCHSRTVSEQCLSLDLAGITLALLATYLSGVYYSFFCQPWWRDFYLLTVGGIFAVAAGAQLSPKFAQDRYATLRISLFAFWAVYGVVPTFHWVVLHGGFDNALVVAFLPRIVAMYAICGAAFFIYLSKMPERFVPGHLDIFGHSHQWWHFLVLLGLIFWHHNGIIFATFRIDHGCTPANEEMVRHLRLWPF